MNNKELIIKYFNILKRKKLLTPFIAHIFNYQELNDYNYIFRIKKEEHNIIIDIYDNINKINLNKYIFDYSNSNYKIKKHKEKGINITKIYIKNIKNSNKKIYKLAYLFTLNKDDIEKYAKTFLKQEYIDILLKIINKPT